MMQRSRANEIQELVRRLGSKSRSTVDSARARLAIIGARSVEQLIEGLEGDNNRVRARVMPLLALIQDPRGREPIIAMLLDNSARLRETAARCLARFPSSNAVAALNRTLKKDRDIRVRVAAAHALVEQYIAEQEQALRLLLPLLVDTSEPPELRLAACSVLRALRPAQRRSILNRLKSDEDASIHLAAEKLLSDDSCGEADEPCVVELLEKLAAPDYPTWNEAVLGLRANGRKIIVPLIGQMCARQRDPEYCTRAGMVLKSLGPRRGKLIADALETVDEPLPLQVLVEVIGALGEKALIYRLKDLIERLGQRPPSPAGRNGFDPVQRVRAKAHLELARVGSRVAIQDLREALSEPGRRVELELLAAVEMIGKRDELSLLLGVYGREDRYMKDRIAHAVEAIMKRERIRRNNKMFRSLGSRHRAALAQIRPPASRA